MNTFYFRVTILFILNKNIYLVINYYKHVFTYLFMKKKNLIRDVTIKFMGFI